MFLDVFFAFFLFAVATFLIVGLAARGILADWWSGLALRREASLRRDDFVKIGGHRGTVESLGALAVTLRTPGNCLVRVPNHLAAAKALTRWNRHAVSRLEFEVRARIEDDLDAIRTLIEEAACAAPCILEHPSPRVRLEAVEGKFARFALLVWLQASEAEAAVDSVPSLVWKRFVEADRVISIRRLSGVASPP